MGGSPPRRKRPPVGATCVAPPSVASAPAGTFPARLRSCHKRRSTVFFRRGSDLRPAPGGKSQSPAPGFPNGWRRVVSLPGHVVAGCAVQSFALLRGCTSSAETLAGERLIGAPTSQPTVWFACAYPAQFPQTNKVFSALRPPANPAQVRLARWALLCAQKATGRGFLARAHRKASACPSSPLWQA